MTVVFNPGFEGAGQAVRKYRYLMPHSRPFKSQFLGVR